MYEEPLIKPIIQQIPHHAVAAEDFLIAYGKEPDSQWKHEPWVAGMLEEAEQMSTRVRLEALEKRNKILDDAELLTLSEEDFNTYFPFFDLGIGEKGVDMQQRNTGNCYLVSVVEALCRWSHFEMVCRSSVKRNPDASWEVQVPFMNERGDSVTITQRELQVDDKGLLPLEGAEGYQVLEAAYMKSVFGTVDRKAAYGGFPGDVVSAFFGSDFFVRANVTFSDIFDDI